MLSRAVAMLLFTATPSEVIAQSWPTKQPIKIISPFAPGAAPEAIGRPVFDHVSKQLGQTVVWENRAGAGGTIGAATVAKADPDGYTLLVNTSAHTAAPAIFASLRYDVVKDFASVALVGELPVALIVPITRYKTLGEMVTAGKAKPGSLTYGSAGVGSGSHFIAEKFRVSAGLEAVHVPFKGAPDMVREIIGNRIDFAFANLGSALPMIEANEVRAVAVSGKRRAASRPELQTTVEAGFANSDSGFWVGTFAPAGTPADIVQRLHRAITAAVTDQAMKTTLANLGAEPMLLSPSELDALVRAEVTGNAALVKAAGIKVN